RVPDEPGLPARRAPPGLPGGQAAGPAAARSLIHARAQGHDRSAGDDSPGDTAAAMQTGRLRGPLQRSGRGSALDRFLVATLDLVPVDDVVERADVVRAAVLVLQVVGVLPHVQAQDRGVAR